MPFPSLNSKWVCQKRRARRQRGRARGAPVSARPRGRPRRAPRARAPRLFPRRRRRRRPHPGAAVKLKKIIIINSKWLRILFTPQTEPYLRHIQNPFILLLSSCTLPLTFCKSSEQGECGSVQTCHP